MQNDELKVSKLINGNKSINKLFNQAYINDFITSNLMELDLYILKI